MSDIEAKLVYRGPMSAWVQNIEKMFAYLQEHGLNIKNCFC